MGGENRRGAQRHRVLKDGKIVTLNKWSLIDCCIRDLSESGARLRCADALAVPDRFRLLMPSDQKIREARVIWRLEGQVGVTFTGPLLQAPPRKW